MRGWELLLRLKLEPGKPKVVAPVWRSWVEGGGQGAARGGGQEKQDNTKIANTRVC